MNTTQILKNTYNEINKESIEYLTEYLKQIGGRTLKDNCKRQNILKIKRPKNQIPLIARCHIQSAVEYLHYLKNDFTKEQIVIIIADIAKYVKILDSNENTSFIFISTNTLPSVMHFGFAEDLFYKHKIKQQNQNNYSTDLLTLYALRLSLENRIRGLLGIDFATSNDKNIGLSSFIKIAKKLEEVEYSKEINWNEIEWVNNWLNHHMHRHIRPFPWIIFQTIKILKPLLDPKEPITKNDKEIYSCYSSTYIESETKLEKEIECKFKKKYPNIEITWLSEREITKKDWQT